MVGLYHLIVQVLKTLRARFPTVSSALTMLILANNVLLCISFLTDSANHVEPTAKHAYQVHSVLHVKQDFSYQQLVLAQPIFHQTLVVLLKIARNVVKVQLLAHNAQLDII